MRIPRFTVSLLAVSLLYAAAPIAHAAGALQLDFRQAVKLTLASSPQLRESRGQLKAAHGAATAAKGQRWPQLSASIEASRSNDPLHVFGAKLSQRRATFADFGADQFTGPASLNVAPQALNYPGAYNNFDTSVQIEWPLYQGGRTSAAISEAEAQIKAARNGNLAARQEVIFSVLRAYEGVRAADAELNVAKRARTAAASYLATARKRYKQGTALKSDLLTAQVSYDQSRLHERNARDQLENAREYLRILTGVPEGTDIAIGPPAQPDLPTQPLTELKSEALVSNPTLAALRDQVTSSRAAVSGEKAAYLPRFSLVLRRDWNDRTLGLSAPSYTVAGVVSWDLVDFGTRRGSVAQATGKLDSAEGRFDAYKQRLLVDVDRSWRTAREAADRVEVNSTAVAQASEAQRILKLRFDQGLTTITELLDGQARLQQAQANLVTARYQLRVSRAALLAELGLLDLSHIKETASQPAPAPATNQTPGDPE